MMRRLLLSTFLVLALFVYYAKLPVKTKSLNSSNTIVTYAFAPKSAGATLRVVTYNLGYAYGDKNNQGVVLSRDQVLQNLDVAVALFTRLAPDVICLQEVDFDAHRTFGIDELDYLAKHLGFYNAAYAVNWSKNYVAWPYWPVTQQFGRMVSGQGILSRFPILSNDITIFPKPPNAFWYNWFYLDRAAQRVGLDLGSEHLALWNVHLEAFHRPTRVAQAAELAQIVNVDTVPAKVVVGDFNDPRVAEKNLHGDNAVFTFIRKTMLQADLEFAEQLTFPASQPVEKLDHLFFSKDFNLMTTSTRVLPTSDHLPLIVDLQRVKSNPRAIGDEN